MFYAMKFELIEGMYYVRAIRSKGYNTPESAKQAVLKSGCEGYVKKLGMKQPVWSNAHGV